LPKFKIRPFFKGKVKTICAHADIEYARVITNPNDADIHPGEILVTQRTDPGWIMLFPIATGVLVEYGSLLSHAAIVVREMGIPAVVSVKDLFAHVKTGDLIELDGERGLVTIVEKRN